MEPTQDDLAAARRLIGSVLDRLGAVAYQLSRSPAMLAAADPAGVVAAVDSLIDELDRAHEHLAGLSYQPPLPMS